MSTNVLSDGWSSGSEYGTITEIVMQPTNNGVGADILVRADIPGNPTSCTTKNTFHVDVTGERGKRFFSILLSAHAANKKVRFYVRDNGCTIWNSPWVDGVSVK